MSWKEFYGCGVDLFLLRENGNEDRGREIGISLWLGRLDHWVGFDGSSRILRDSPSRFPVTFFGFEGDPNGFRYLLPRIDNDFWG